jgi:hypothetical protein
MGRIGTLRAKWIGLSRAARAGLVVAAVGVGAAVAGAAVDAAAGRDVPAPVVWHDQVSDGTVAPPAAP